MRIGHGYDVHRFAEGRKLVLGGVEISYDRGLLGHSDADVLLHAISDALLGAAALGDIGTHFPDTDEKYRGISSAKLLCEVVKLIEQGGLTVANIDCTIVALEPKLMPYVLQMRKNIAALCHVDLAQISVKATTEEGVGLGKEAIGAHAVCLLNGVEGGFCAFM